MLMLMIIEEALNLHSCKGLYMGSSEGAPGARPGLNLNTMPH